jgi:opacity protein-like surface antigen
MKYLILAAALATVAIAPAFAADAPAEGAKMHHLNLTPEQKAKMQKRMEEGRAKWEKMTPEQ